MTSIKWRPKRDADGNIIPGCWETSVGYTVAEFRTPDRQQVAALIDADQRALA